jgi:hypothetical protein
MGAFRWRRALRADLVAPSGEYLAGYAETPYSHQDRPAGFPSPDCAGQTANVGKSLASCRIQEGAGLLSSDYPLAEPGVAALPRKEHNALPERSGNHAPLTIADAFTL